jgi:dihydroneopterin aldolase
VGKIKLKNVRIYAYHGCLVEEGQIGSEYRVDLVINANLLKSAKTDNLSDTVDYVFLNKIIEKEMAIRSKLLETVANRIIDRILSESKLVNKVKVVISKINPPIEGDVEMVSIIMERSRI